MVHESTSPACVSAMSAGTSTGSLAIYSYIDSDPPPTHEHTHIIGVYNVTSRLHLRQRVKQVKDPKNTRWLMIISK